MVMMEVILKREKGGGAIVKGNVKTLKRPSVDKDEAKRGKISSWPEFSILLIFHLPMTQVCTDGSQPKRPSPCQDESEPMCR